MSATTSSAGSSAPSGQSGRSERTVTAAPRLFRGEHRVTATGCVVAVTLIAFEAIAVATALPSAARDLDGVGSYGWLFTGFLVATMVGMVLGGGWADQRGARRPVVLGLAGFAGGLVLAGAAPDVGILVLARIVQGVGSGMLFVALYVVIGARFPESLQPRMMAAISAAWVVPALVGPLVAGTLAQTVGWRWVFWGIAPFVGVCGLLLVPTIRTLVPVPRPDAARLRGRLALALVVAAGIALFQEAGHVAPVLLVPVAAAGLVVVAAGLSRLLPRGWWRVAPGVAGPVTLRGVVAGAFFGIDALVPLTLQTQHGFSPLQAGVPLTCGAVTWALGSFVQGRDRWTTRQRIGLLQLGCGLVAVSALVMAAVAAPGTWPWLAAGSQAVAGVGVGLAMTAVSVLLLRFTTDADRGRDSSSMQLFDSVGAALATGFGGIAVALATAGTVGFHAAFATVFIVMAAVAGLGALVGGRVRAGAP